MGKHFPCKWKPKEHVAILRQNRLYPKTVKTENHYIMLKGSIKKEKITFVNLFTQHSRILIYKGQMKRPEGTNI